jgi:phosphohistidine swiveling domain-containing protein
MRLVRNLVNPASHPEAAPKGKVAITDKLYPSDVIERYSNAKAIIVTGKDMAENGHAVFLAAGLGITLIAAPGLDANSVPDDTDISIDTDRGVIEFMPPAAPAVPAAPPGRTAPSAATPIEMALDLRGQYDGSFRAAVDVNSVMREAAAEAGSEEYGAYISFELSPELDGANAPKALFWSRVEQATGASKKYFKSLLRILVSNAVYLRANVRVRTYIAPDGRIAVDIADDGRGINIDALKEGAKGAIKLRKLTGYTAEAIDAMDDQAALALLFKRNVSGKADISMTKLFGELESSGKGLGLAVAAEMLKLSRGEIRVSTVKGKGTTFTVILDTDRVTEKVPVAPAPVATPQVPLPPASAINAAQPDATAGKPVLPARFPADKYEVVSDRVHGWVARRIDNHSEFYPLDAGGNVMSTPSGVVPRIAANAPAAPVPQAAPAAPVSVPGAGLVTVKGKILPDRPSVKRGVVRGAAWKNTAESFEAFAAPGRREYDRDFTEDEIQDAIDETVRQMEELKTETLRAEDRAGYGDSQNVLGGIFDAHIMTMLDPEFMRMIKERISKGEKPARAILETGRHYNNLLLNMEDEYLRQRAPDTCDVTMRLVRNLVNPASHPEAVPKGKVAITDKLYPSDVIERYSNAKAIIVTGKDMAENGHAVFLAAGLGITLIAAPGLDANSVPDDTDISIDTDRGVIEFMPPAAPAAPVGNLIFDAGLSAADREKLIREGGRVLADGSIVPPRWTDWQNSIYRMNLSFRYIMNGDLTDRLIALKALAEQKRARGETLYILDWGAGDLTAAVELAELLKIHGITNFRIIATGDTYFRVMKQVPEEVTVVIGTAENLAGHLTRILNGGKIEAVYSNFGIRYLYARGNTDRFMEHIRSLLPHLSDGAFVVYSGYRRGSEDGAGYPNDIRAAGQLKEYFESVILEPSGDDRGNVLLLERLKRPAAAPVAPASVSALRPETAVPAPAVSAAAGMPIVKPELPGGTAGGVPVVEIASPRQTAAGLAMTGVEQQTAAGLAMTGVEQQTAAGSAMTQVAVLTVPAGAGMASYNEAAQTAKSDDTVARVGQTLSNTLAGNEYHIFVSGAVPTEDVTAQDETAAGSAAAELKNPVNDVQVAGKHLISDKLKLAASITHTIGLEKARDAIAGDAATSVKNLRETVAREAISYTISAHVLKALERDEALKAKLGMSVEKYLRENTLLDVVSDEADKKVYLMSYLQATNMALARLNLVKVLTNRKPEDIEKDEYCRAALKLYCDAVGLMSGWRSEEIEKFRAELVRAIAAGDQGPTGFFKNYNFSIILPPVAKINFSDMKSALAAMTQVLQSM